MVKKKKAKIEILSWIGSFCFQPWDVGIRFLLIFNGFLSHFHIYSRNGSIAVTGRYTVKMSIAKPLKKLASCVILDLDGTLINTG